MTLAAEPFQWPERRRGAVSLSFDDARPSQLDRCIPLLNSHGVRATFYVSLPNMNQRLGEWKDVIESDHEIGNHTVSHPCSGNFKWSRSRALEDYTLERMEAEFVEANGEIERALGVRPQTFAYPCGQKFVGRGEKTESYVPLVARFFLAGRGFRDEAPNDPAFCDPAQLAAVDGDCLTFKQYRVWLERTAAEGGWLILAGHDVGEAPTQCVRPAALDSLCRYCLDPANGLWIDTVEAVARWTEDGKCISM